MKILLSLLGLICLFTGTAQQTKNYNDANAVTRNISSSFTKISVSSGVELFLTQGNETALAISVSDSKYEPRFKTEVTDGVLKIYYDSKGVSWTNDRNRKLKAYLSFKQLDEIKASAGSSVTLTNPLLAETLSLSFSSGSAITGKVKTTALSADLESGAEVNVSGSASRFTVMAGSGAVFKGFYLVTDYCKAEANSGAAISIEVQKEITASANSGGDVRFKGNAQLKKGNINSGGSVKHVSK